MIKAIQPTSKAALKQQCLIVSKGDLKLATELYDFMIKDMEDLPLFDAIPPTKMQVLKEGAASTFNWLNENQDTILNWVGFFKNLLGKGGNITMPPSGAPIPPIN